MLLTREVEVQEGKRHVRGEEVRTRCWGVAHSENHKFSIVQDAIGRGKLTRNIRVEEGRSHIWVKKFGRDVGV